MSIRAVVRCLIAGAWIAAPGLARADGVLSVPSRTMTDEAFLAGTAEAGAPVEIGGRLTGLTPGAPRPVVILVHGSNGPRSGAAWNWSQFLATRGIASFRLDSYSGRGITNVSADQSAAAQFMPIYDAYRAVEVLAATPGIDPERIYLMGFSRGGIAALYASLDRFREAHGPRVGQIAGYFPFYPGCNFTLERELEVAKVPIRVFHGAADDWTPIGPCRDYVARLSAAGADATLTALPGVHHGFDDPTAPSLHTDPDWLTSRACHRFERDGTLMNAETGAPFTYDDACVQRGPHSGFDGPATEAAQRAVLEVLEVLGR
ncbi:dienelactone hydrolase family protein [Pseudooceanicola sp. LIPI14-2-Ac024]|uniref:dienelactone hydrolase family protein n=1 Tax=Pseudooceanicola sp. LIPI14-2-Ac024 TaxID=3344875 RepID=UPI0035D133F6